MIFGVFNDFLGKSIFIKHENSSVDNAALCTIFGHLNPKNKIYPGMRLKEGQVIASVARTKISRVSTHLHISIGWLKKEVIGDIFDWKVISNSEALKLIDPIEIIGKYALVSSSVLI